MPELCDKCDCRESDGKCSVCSEQEQEYFIDKDLCNFALVRGHSVTMKRYKYYLARRWYGKGESIRVSA